MDRPAEIVIGIVLVAIIAMLAALATYGVRQYISTNKVEWQVIGTQDLEAECQKKDGLLFKGDYQNVCIKGDKVLWKKDKPNE